MDSLEIYVLTQLKQQFAALKADNERLKAIQAIDLANNGQYRNEVAQLRSYVADLTAQLVEMKRELTKWQQPFDPVGVELMKEAVLKVDELNTPAHQARKGTR